MNDLKQIAGYINKNDDFLLVGHSIPDGDCIGSLIGMYLGLVSQGKKVQMILEDPVPAIYDFLAGSRALLDPAQIKETYGTVIFLDCADEERSGKKVSGRLINGKYTINLDHHLSNTLFGDLNYIDAKSSSTAEIVYEVLQNLKVKIDKEMATALYVGIFQDTGGFQHNSTTGQTFRTAAALIDRGVDLDEIKLNLIESKSKEEIALLAMALQSISYSPNGKIAWMTLNYNDIKSIQALEVCPEGIINHSLTIQGVEMGLLFRELSPGLIKVGFRSKGKADVAEIAAQFGGGGHQRAAGAQQQGTMEEVERRLILAIESVVK